MPIFNGPSVGMMLGRAGWPKSKGAEQKYFIPIEAHGLKTNSMAYLANDKTPMSLAWPSGSQVFLCSCCSILFGAELDYLNLWICRRAPVISKLTLAQKVPVTGAGNCHYAARILL